MENIKHCQICGHSEFSDFLELKDWFLTQERFVISKCNFCDFHFTNPRPYTNDLNSYYESKDYISHSTEKKGIINSMYLLTRYIMIRSKYRKITKLAQGNKLLDIGCGTGELLNHFKNNGWHAVGIEPNEKARSFAVEEYGLNVFDENEIQKFEPESFDVVTMWHVLEHVVDLNKRIEDIKGILKKGGTLFVALPNHHSLDAQKYGKYWAAYDVPRHLYHFSRSTTKKLFEKHQLNVTKIIPMKLDAFYICVLSEKYKSEKINYFKGFLNGLRANQYARKNRKEYSSLIYVIKNK